MNNKLQYLQKLATNPNQKQAIMAISKKPNPNNTDPSSNLVGIAANKTSKGMPYAAGTRKGPKNVKHQPQRNPVPIQDHQQNKIVPKKNKSNIRINAGFNGTNASYRNEREKINYQLPIDVSNPDLDKLVGFNEMSVIDGLYEDQTDQQCLDMKRQNRRNQMQNRR